MPLPSFKDSIPNYPDFSSDGSDLLNFAQMLLPDNPLRNRVFFNRTRFGVYRVPRNRLWRGSRKYRTAIPSGGVLSSDQVVVSASLRLCPNRCIASVRRFVPCVDG